jgi:hypothetical protein
MNRVHSTGSRPFRPRRGPNGDRAAGLAERIHELYPWIAVASVGTSTFKANATDRRTTTIREQNDTTAGDGEHLERSDDVEPVDSSSVVASENDVSLSDP